MDLLIRDNSLYCSFDKREIQSWQKYHVISWSKTNLTCFINSHCWKAEITTHCSSDSSYWVRYNVVVLNLNSYKSVMKILWKWFLTVLVWKYCISWVVIAKCKPVLTFPSRSSKALALKRKRSNKGKIRPEFITGNGASLSPLSTLNLSLTHGFELFFCLLVFFYDSFLTT